MVIPKDYYRARQSAHYAYLAALPQRDSAIPFRYIDRTKGIGVELNVVLLASIQPAFHTPVLLLTTQATGRARVNFGLQLEGYTCVPAFVFQLGGRFSELPLVDLLVRIVIELHILA
jgi:hypothetical protein